MQEMNFVTILGQIFGIIAVILGFICYQMNSQKKILIAQTATALTFCIHYLLIGATSGLVMNILAIFRNLAYYHRDKKIFSGKKCPIFFAVVMGIAGILSWQDYYSIFVVLGLVINTLCFSLPNPQDIRKSINSQMLTVFALPLLPAVLHLSFAFPMVQKLLALFNLRNTALMLTVTGITVLAFGLFYALTYKLTAGAYYNIVTGAKE